MSRTVAKQKPSLTEYETRQVEKIAAWKAEYPNPFGELFRRAAQPIAKVVEAVFPDSLALAAINAAYRASELSATRSDIEVQAGVGDLSELRHKPMEVCDALSRRVGTIAQGTAIVEGALTGAGGVWTTLLDVPLLFTLCIRTIIKTGHCYGYALDRPTDKAWVLGALAVALSSTKERRTELMARLREIEDLLLEETQEQVVVEETASLLTQIEVFEDIPVFGAVTGGLLNLSVAHRADVTARHLFQERWLRDQGKVDEIEPAPELEDALADRLVGRLLPHRLYHHLRCQLRRGIPGLSRRRGLGPGHRFDPLGLPRRGQGGDRRSRRLARRRPPAGTASPGPHSKEGPRLAGA